LQGLDAVILEFSGKRFAQADNTSKGKRDPNNARNDLLCCLLVHGEAKTKNQDDNQRKEHHGGYRLPAA